MLLLVALTGGIATGKSVVGRIWEQLGCYIHESDRAAHSLMEPGSPAWKNIVARFGPQIIKEDRTIDRPRLAERVFASPEDRDFMNKLIHPLVLEQKKDLITQVRKQGQHRIFVSEAALTIEAGYIDFFHKVVVTVCPSELQLERLMERDRITRADALRKIRSQMPAETKADYADYVIHTEASLPSTLEQAEQVYRFLMQDYHLLGFGSDKDAG
jgi:dephospho-CoA kinase